MIELLQEAWLIRRKDPAEALNLTERLLAEGADLAIEERVRALTSRAAALAALHRLGDASQVADEAERLMAELDEEDPQLRFELDRVRGRAALVSYRELDALRLALGNLDLARRVDDSRMIAQAHSEVAACYGVALDFRKSLDHLMEGLRLTPETELQEYALLLNNLGNVYMELNRGDEALACYTKARQAFVAARSRLHAAIALSNEGRVLSSLGQHERALESLRQALDEFEAGGFQAFVPATHYKIGNTLMAAGEPVQAESHFLAALAHYRDATSEGYEYEARQAYAIFLVESERWSEAVEQYSRNLELVRARGKGLERKEMHELEALAGAMEKAGDVPGALKRLKELVALRDRQEKEEPRPRMQSELLELQLSLEREHELVRATAGALVDANLRLAEQSKELTTLATTDHLTRLRNRRYFTQRLEHALWGSRASDAVFGLVLIDVDSFKAVNDGFGHEVGDLVLQQLSVLLVRGTRESDVVARWGGEEFVILLHGPAREDTLAIAEKLRADVERFQWAELAEGLSVTISAGVLCSADYPDASAEEILRAADVLLYTAKERGRNRVVLGGES